MRMWLAVVGAAAGAGWWLSVRSSSRPGLGEVLLFGIACACALTLLGSLLIGVE